MEDIRSREGVVATDGWNPRAPAVLFTATMGLSSTVKVRQPVLPEPSHKVTTVFSPVYRDPPGVAEASDEVYCSSTAQGHLYSLKAIHPRLCARDRPFAPTSASRIAHRSADLIASLATLGVRQIAGVHLYAFGDYQRLSHASAGLMSKRPEPAGGK